MRIFHGFKNICGMAGLMAAEQRKLGVDALSVINEPTVSQAYGFPYDRAIEHSDTFALAKKIVDAPDGSENSFGVFQFYFGESLFAGTLADLPVLRDQGKKVFMYFCGCDIRDAKQVIGQHRWNVCSQCWPALCSRNRRRALAMALAHADGIFVSTPDLLEFVPGSLMVPQAVDINRASELRRRWAAEETSGRHASAPVRIVHSPTNRALKGSDYLIAAVEKLRSTGHNIELDLIEGLSHEDALRRIYHADIGVDQLVCGAHGTVSVEMMALGKPVICFIRPDLRRHYPIDLPIVSADPDCLSVVLTELVEDRQRRVDLGEAGIAYVARHHSSSVIAGQLLQHYLSF